MRIRAALGNLAVAALSVALVILALETALRLGRGRGGAGKEEATLDRYSDHDPVLGWRKRPGARATYNRREYRVEIAINSQGLRDRERVYQAPPGSFRILALGDSFIEGYSVPLEATVTQVLEKSLAGPGCPVEVLNGGTSAYSTDQEYLFYREEGHRYGPHVIALFFYYNDVYFNTRASTSATRSRGSRSRGRARSPGARWRIRSRRRSVGRIRSRRRQARRSSPGSGTG